VSGDPLEVGEGHLDFLALAAGAEVLRRLGHASRYGASRFMDAADDHAV
jgi:hypothetical protein